MKILGICCSPRKGGNTEFLLREALQGAQQEGAEIEFFSVSGKDLKPCDACNSCKKTGECHIQDDMQELFKKIAESKGIIFGVPSYFYGMAAEAKIIIDRTIAINNIPGRNLANKVGGVITVAASLGLADIMKDIYFFMVTKQMIPANFVAGYALQKDEAKNLPNGIKAARDLGRQMVKIAAKGFEYPSDIKGSEFGYGTWNK